jgi:hypothetical protein
MVWGAKAGALGRLVVSVLGKVEINIIYSLGVSDSFLFIREGTGRTGSKMLTFLRWGPIGAFIIIKAEALLKVLFLSDLKINYNLH